MSESGGDIYSGGGYECIGAGRIWEILHFHVNFAMNVKLT